MTASKTSQLHRARKTYGPWLLGLCTLVILGVLATTVDWRRLWNAFLGADGEMLFLSLVLTVFFPVLCTTRWLAVLKSQGVKMPFGRAFRIVMACQPVGNLTPGKAGDFIKGTVCPSRSVGLGTVLAERVVDVAVLGVFGLLFGAIVNSPTAMLGGLVGVGGAVAIIVGARTLASLIRGKPLAEKLNGFLLVFPRLARRPRLLAACVLSSALNWFLSMMQLWLLLHAFGEKAPLTLIIAILPAATFAGLIPIPTFAGAGPRDAALLYLTLNRVDQAAMLAASIVYTFFGYFLLGLAGLPFLKELTRREKPNSRRS
ncbi:flippase-like domain-containing protein [Candidatus Sumerlaeota bacterium]|nr:flippase-like domain-containing protein [Candidatus Sumerlaeota bacterium]